VSLSVAVLGATGAVGGEALKALLRDPAVARVTTLGRRPAHPGGHPKLIEHVVDVALPASYEALLAGHDAAICTLGVGQPSGMSDEEFRRIDFQYVLDFAAACERQDVKHFSLLGAVGANPRSRYFYLRLKGELEAAIAKLGFERASFFRPSNIITPANRYGLAQALVLAVWPRLDPLLAGPLRKFRGIRVEELGRAIARNAAQPSGGSGGRVEILYWDDFKRLGQGA
jgi:uncharacterized protein YbjT (DUF2867 family)